MTTILGSQPLPRQLADHLRKGFSTHCGDVFRSPQELVIEINCGAHIRIIASDDERNQNVYFKPSCTCRIDVVVLVITPKPWCVAVPAAPGWAAPVRIPNAGMPQLG